MLLSSTSYLPLSFFMIFQIPTDALQIPQNTNFRLTKAPIPPSLNISWSSNGQISAPASKTSLNASNDIYCSEGYGIDLSLDSCRDAIGQIPRDRKIIHLGERHEGLYDLNLPHRFVSGQ